MYFLSHLVLSMLYFKTHFYDFFLNDFSLRLPILPHHLSLSIRIIFVFYFWYLIFLHLHYKAKFTKRIVCGFYNQVVTTFLVTSLSALLMNMHSSEQEQGRKK